MEARSRISLNIRAGWVSIIGNTILFGIKIWAGIASSSIAIIADAWHSMSDTLTSVVVVIGNRIVRKPADREHPFGHGRAEPIAAIIIGILLSVVAFDFVLSSVRAVRNHEAGNFGLFAIIVTAVSVISKEVMARYSFRIARLTRSESVKADGWHHRSDALSSLVVLVGIFLSPYAWWIDAALGLAVAILIFWVAYKILKTTISNLMGESPSPMLLEDVSRICHEYSTHPLNPHHFHTHQYGNHTEMTFHVSLPGNMSIDEAHELVDGLEKKLLQELGVEATIHVDPA
jgi:cation diffusion facilitator family transporter